MTDSAARKPDKSLIGIGLAVGGGGLYFVLVGLGLVPEPSRAHAPGFVIVCAGLAFFAGGMAVLIRGVLGMADRETELPPDTPRTVVALASLCAVTVVASLAMIGTWIAFGAGTREFSGTGPFISGSIGETVGRTVFGIGAVITWLMVIVIVRVSAKKLLAGPERTQPR